MLLEWQEPQVSFVSCMRSTGSGIGREYFPVVIINSCRVPLSFA